MGYNKKNIENRVFTVISPLAPLPLSPMSFQYFFLFIAVQKLRASLSLPCFFSMSFRSSAISSCDCFKAQGMEVPVPSIPYVY